MNITTKAALSRELQIDRSRMTQLSKLGLPTRPDGKLDRAEALAWLVRFSNSTAGGWGAMRGQTQTLNERAAALLSGQPASTPIACPRLVPKLTEREQGIREVMDRLLERSVVLPELLVRLGVRDMAAIAGVMDVFQCIVCELAAPLDDQAYCWNDGDDLPLVTAPDYRAIAKRLRLKFDAKAIEEAVDSACDAAYAFFNPEANGGKGAA